MFTRTPWNAHLLVITLFVSPAGNSERICPEKTTLLGAIQCCESKGVNQYLPTIQSHEDKMLAGTFIGKGETWVNLKIVVSSEWKTTGERNIEHSFTKPGWKYKEGECGIMKKRDGHIGLTSCSRQGLGAICERPDCRSCMILGRFAHNCFHFETRCYAVYCGLGNWFDARALCRRFGMDLAPPEVRVLHKFSSIHMPSIPPRCKKAWIGLYRTSWEQIKPLGIETVTTPLWAPGQPNKAGSCAVLRRFNHGDFLVAADCYKTHGYICKAYKAREATDTTENGFSTQVYKDASSVVSTTSPGQNATFILLLIVVIIIVIAIVLFVLVLGVYGIKQLRKKRRNGGNDPQETVSLQSTTASHRKNEAPPNNVHDQDTDSTALNKVC